MLKLSTKMTALANKLADLFGYFNNREWIYESKVADEYQSKMSAKDRIDFPFDVR